MNFLNLSQRAGEETMRKAVWDELANWNEGAILFSHASTNHDFSEAWDNQLTGLDTMYCDREHSSALFHSAIFCKQKSMYLCPE